MFLRKHIFTLILALCTGAMSLISSKASATNDDLEDVLIELQAAIYDKNEQRALEILQNQGHRINVNELHPGERNGETWLHYAAENGLLNVAQELLNRGARITQDRYDRTPADMAELYGHHHLIPLLNRSTSSGPINLVNQARQHMQQAMQNQGGWRSYLPGWLSGVGVGSN